MSAIALPPLAFPAIGILPPAPSERRVYLTEWNGLGLSVNLRAPGCSVNGPGPGRVSLSLRGSQ
jgi:hypothetical protein